MNFGTDVGNARLVRWFFCRPEAQPLGFPTPFTSRNWVAPGEWGTLGEVEEEDRPWRDGGLEVIVDGTHGPCGRRDVWANGWAGPNPPGLARDDAGVSWCCFVQSAPNANPTFGFVPRAHIFLPPAIALNSWGNAGFASSVIIGTLPGATPGNLLVLSIIMLSNGGSINTPAGWTLKASIAGGQYQLGPDRVMATLAIYYREHAPLTGLLIVSCNPSPGPCSIGGIVAEFSNTQGLGISDVSASNSGTGTLMNSGSTPATNFDNELIVAVFATEKFLAGPPSPGYTFIRAAEDSFMFYANSDVAGPQQVEQDTSAVNSWVSLIVTFERR